MVLAAVTQLTSGPNPLENADTAVDLIQRAAKAGAKVVFLPEATDFISSPDRVGELTYCKDNRTFVDRMLQAAKENNVFVSVGIHEPAEEEEAKRAEERRCYNTQLLINDKGDDVGRYRKTHMFDVEVADLKIKESNTTVPGRSLLPPVPTPIGNLGPLICYDLRFPEPALHLRTLGAQVISYPSAFVVRTGPAHWEPLLRARAIETQCWIMASAQVGKHPGTERVSWGHAMIVDAFGSVVAQCGDLQPHRPCFAVAEVDLDNLDNLRKHMPLWEQRRNDGPDALYPVI